MFRVTLPVRVVTSRVRTVSRQSSSIIIVKLSTVTPISTHQETQTKHGDQKLFSLLLFCSNFVVVVIAAALVVAALVDGVNDGVIVVFIIE